MRENEFEKQVREKMDQLGFDPSENVWAVVNKEINPEKKRRRLFFWIFVCSVFMLAGGGYYFFKAGNNIAAMSKMKLRHEKDYSKENSRSDKSGQPANGIKSEKEIQQDTGNNLTVKKQTSLSVILKTQVEYLKTAMRLKRQKKASKIQNQNNLEERSDDISINNYNKVQSQIITGSSKDREMDSARVKMQDSITAKKVSKSYSITRSSDTAVDTVKKRKNKSGHWKIGFASGAGISYVSQTKGTDINASAYNAAYPPVRLVNTGGGDSLRDKINPGLSFCVGAFVTRSFTDRISFTAGLNYQYFSTTVAVGTKVNTSAPVYFSPNQLSGVNSYYQAGGNNTFTNQYHVIEMPVSVNFQLNKIKQSPVIFQLGFSLAYLANSDALYYDSYSQIFVSATQQINKMQWNAFTALLFGFHLNKNEWQIGPQLQYNFSKLYNTQTDNSDHLLYCGIKILFIPIKK